MKKVNSIEEMIKMMQQAGVPPDMIPRLVQRKRDQQTVQSWREKQQEMAEGAQKREETQQEKERREAFSLFLLFLLLILNLNAKDCASWFHQAFRAMADQRREPNPILGQQEFIERSFAAVALIKYPQHAVLEAAQWGVPGFERTENFNRGDVTITMPMKHAIAALHKFNSEQLEEEQQENEQNHQNHQNHHQEKGDSK